MKRYPYEGGHRVPGIVRLPGVIPAGIISDKLFNGTDIFPTICESVDAPLPSGEGSFSSGRSCCLNQGPQVDFILWEAL